MADRVEMSVCEDCGRFFMSAAMAGGSLCPSCAARHTAPKKGETPLGFKKVTCADCGNMFLAPAKSTSDYCWKCSDRRRRAADRRRRKSLGAPPAGMEWHECMGCGEVFARKKAALGRPRVFCAACAKMRDKAANRRAHRKYVARIRKEAHNGQ